ncbi:hypothetical protein SAMN04487844_1465 [Methylobacterium sp. yr596]|nr:hypothetical protein SAMN04487844_1465 [Methylobacterium sp. yr596]
MLSLRTLLVAMVAACLAAIPAGIWRASAPIGVTASRAADGLRYAHGGARHHHGVTGPHEDAPVSFTAEPDDDGCMHHASGGKRCAPTCCGFACHAFEPSLAPGLTDPPSRTSDCHVTNDEQVEGGTPFRIERPPRAA